MTVKNIIDLCACEKIILAHDYNYSGNSYTGGYLKVWIDEVPEKYLNFKVVAILPEDDETLQISLKSSDRLLFDESCYPLLATHKEIPIRK